MIWDWPYEHQLGTAPSLPGPPVPLYDDVDGLTHVSQFFADNLKTGLQAVAFELPQPPPLTFELSPTVGSGGWGVVEKLGSDGYVILVHKLAPGSPAKILVTKSPLIVADAARTGSTHAILTGSAIVTNLAEAALTVKAAPSQKWFVPVALGLGVLGVILFIRR